MPTSLVTGAAGFMGSHVARHLHQAGHRVVGVDDLSGGFVDNVPPGVELTQCSLTDHEKMTYLFYKEKPDYVFHLAAYAAEGLSHFIRRFNYTNNLISSVGLINEAVRHQVKRFVFTSSLAVYGAGQVPMTEDLVPQPEDPYGIAKYAVELDLRAAHELFGLDYTIFRPHNVYGPGQHIGDKYRNVIGIFMNQVMKGEPMTVFGDGLQTRAFSYIDDVAPIIAHCIEVPASVGQVINVGADRYYTMLELACVVADVFGPEYASVGIEHLPPRVEVKHAYASHERLRALFPESVCETDLETGIRLMAEWAKRKGPQQTTPFAGIEVWRNLPPSWDTVVRN